MHTLVLLCINQHTQFEVPDFIQSYPKVWLQAKFFTMVHVTLTTPIRGSLSSEGYHMIYFTCTQNLATRLSRSRDMLWMTKLKLGHVTLTTPF